MCTPYAQDALCKKTVPMLRCQAHLKVLTQDTSDTPYETLSMTSTRVLAGSWSRVSVVSQLQAKSTNLSS